MTKTAEEEGEMTPQEVLLKAADYIEEKGWRQDTVHRPGGPCCAFWALEIASGGNTADLVIGDKDAFDGAHDLLVGHLGLRKGFGIGQWNDAPGRTKDEVVRALREAARTRDTKGNYR